MAGAAEYRDNFGSDISHRVCGRVPDRGRKLANGGDYMVYEVVQVETTRVEVSVKLLHTGCY